MDSRGLLVRVEAIRGKEAQVEDFLRSALPLVREETRTTAWFAVRFGKSEYGIFDVFPDEEARAAHVNGPVAQAAMGQSGSSSRRGPRSTSSTCSQRSSPRTPSPIISRRRCC